MSIFDPASQSRRAAATWRVYDALVVGVAALLYVVVAPLAGRDEGGVKWFSRRMRPPPDLPLPSSPRIWIHAVSAGEAKVAELVRDRVARLDPTISVVFSATTRSGYAKIQKSAPDQAVVMPFDTLGLQRRAVGAVRPHLAVLAETDFWPAHFEALAENRVSVVAVNAILSDRSARRHGGWPVAARATLRRAHHLYVQDEIARQRFERAGAPVDRLEICGNLKLAAGGRARLARTPGEPPTVSFGNVHYSELKSLGPVVARLRRERPDLRIVLVPRHPGRLLALAARWHFGADLTVVEGVRWIGDAGRLVWVNAMGVLPEIYAITNIAIVCGTFARVGGHDLAEPMHHGAISLYGPHIERQLELHSSLSNAGLSLKVGAADALPARIGAFLDNATERAGALDRFAALVSRQDARLDDICRALIDLARRRYSVELGGTEQIRTENPVPVLDVG